MPKITDLVCEREDLPKLLERKKLKGIELGVASGDFSRRMMRTGLFDEFWGVDLYGDHHDTRQYLNAIRKVGLGEPYWLIRASFAEALNLFPREYFDFIYIDGYAHTGEEAGRTFFQWFNKLKVGGMISGHDYDPKWPLVITCVDAFADAAGLEILRTAHSSDPGPLDKCRSWAAIKEKPDVIAYPTNLKSKVARQRKAGKTAKKLVKKSA